MWASATTKTIGGNGGVMTAKYTKTPLRCCGDVYNHFPLCSDKVFENTVTPSELSLK